MREHVWIVISNFFTKCKFCNLQKYRTKKHITDVYRSGIHGSVESIEIDVYFVHDEPGQDIVDCETYEREQAIKYIIE
jgi:hypothetical protein